MANEQQQQQQQQSPLNLSFRITPLKAVKKALRILQNDNLNHTDAGQVMVVVTADRRLEITAQNMSTGVVATAVFQGDALQNFVCNQPLLPPQNELLAPWFHYVFDDPHDDRTILFYILQDFPDILGIGLVERGRDAASVVLPGLLMQPILPYPPEPSARTLYFCDVSIYPTTLDEIIQHIQTDPQQVSVDVKRKRATISTNGHSWSMPCNKGMTSGKKHHARFELRHLESLGIASSEATGALICLPAPPNDHILIVIFLETLGEVQFRFNVLELSSVSDEDNDSPGPGGGDTAESSQSRADATETPQPGGGLATIAWKPGSNADEASQSSGADADDAPEPYSDAAEASKSSGDADEAAQPACDAAETSQPSGNAAETLQPDDVATDTLQFDSDADDEALQSDAEAL